MSVVAVKKTGRGVFEIAADSIRISGWQTQEKDKNAKLYDLGDVVFGTAGTCSVAGIFREFVENHKPKTNNEYGWTNLFAEFAKYMKEISSDLKQENAFLIVYRKRCWLVSGFYVREIKDFYAVGAGADFALAALHLGHGARRAVEIACDLSVYCERPVNHMKV
ncbi:hypothetical protein [Rhodopseudomonas palustris]|uniref:hypothetical protein n=1 Tax=Rhodopseudomonas palustris TaxID=1076 RepID=UPI000D1AEEEA|nr:hypothetical protein [Rhodopseudomonas palustris]